MKSRTPVWKARLLSPKAIAAAVLGVFALIALSTATVQGSSEATITVVFTPDDMGFEATSSKDLSNIIVQYCDLSHHKHEMPGGDDAVNVFNHTETSLILGVWVKSGNNGVGGSAPSGAGERFDNAGVTCNLVTTSSSPPTTSTTVPGTTTVAETTSVTTSVVTTTGDTPTTSSSDPTAPSTTLPTSSPPITSTQIPFSPSHGALALSILGGFGAAFVMFRRRN